MLQARRLTAKLDIYRKFTNALAVAVIMSVGWICYEVMLLYIFKDESNFFIYFSIYFVSFTFYIVMSYRLGCCSFISSQRTCIMSSGRMHGSFLPSGKSYHSFYCASSALYGHHLRTRWGKLFFLIDNCKYFSSRVAYGFIVVGICRKLCLWLKFSRSSVSFSSKTLHVSPSFALRNGSGVSGNPIHKN